MLKEYKNIYLYPNGEDAQAIYVILKNFKTLLSVGEINILDDAREETSLAHNHQRVKENGILWIVHQDRKMYNILFQNAKNLPQEIVCNGIIELEEKLLVYLEKVEFAEIQKNSPNETLSFLNFASYFAMQFYLTLKEEGAFLSILKDLSKQTDLYFKGYFELLPKSVGIAVTTFGGNKHLGDIGDILEQKRVNVVYVYYDEKEFIKAQKQTGKNSIFCPIQLSYMGSFLNLFDLFVTCRMPLTSPSWGSPTIYVSHAFIDPVAALMQRKRTLDDFWFKKKMGINGYRIVPSLSNYQIYKDKFSECGYEKELVCGGYPSLDKNILEYEQMVGGGGGNILIAINHQESILIIKEFLARCQINLKVKQKVYFRPYPGNILQEESEEIAKEYAKYSWFVYDTSKKLDVQIMQDSCCIIGDYSSLVYTFPLTTLKPAILLCRNKDDLENEYLGIKFYNPILHKVASNAKECFEKIQEILEENQQRREENIKEYRKKEVFNSGKSSEFIANFIIQKLEEI